MNLEGGAKSKNPGLREIAKNCRRCGLFDFGFQIWFGMVLRVRFWKD